MYNTKDFSSVSNSLPIFRDEEKVDYDVKSLFTNSPIKGNFKQGISIIKAKYLKVSYYHANINFVTNNFHQDKNNFLISQTLFEEWKLTLKYHTVKKVIVIHKANVIDRGTCTYKELHIGKFKRNSEVWWDQHCSLNENSKVVYHVLAAGHNLTLQIITKVPVQPFKQKIFKAFYNRKA